MFNCELVSDLEKSSPTYDIMFFLKSLKGTNKSIFHLMSRERICSFVEGKVDNLDSLKITVDVVQVNEFVSSKLTEKLEQQMRDTLAVYIGSMPFVLSYSVLKQDANTSNWQHKVVLEYDEEVGTGLGPTLEIYT